MKRRTDPAPLGTSLFQPPPAGTPARTCRYCGATIYFVVTAKGHNMPVNADGRPHAQDCKKPRKGKSR